MKNCFPQILSLVMALSFVSCFESKGVFTDDSTEDYKLYDYYIDNYGNEGIVAYILYNMTSKHKDVVVISLDESYQAWGPMGEAIFKDSVSSTDLAQPSFGVAMHQAMKSIGIERFPAQAWCDQKNKHEIYPRAGSWRLPTREEYRLIFGENGKNVQYLNSALASVNGTTISMDYLYWTCVEDIQNYITIDDLKSDYDQANRSVILTPLNKTHGNKDRWLKKNEYFVRAIKHVYYYQ